MAEGETCRTRKSREQNHMHSWRVAPILILLHCYVADPGQPLKSIRHVILVLSGKGGVGKSTLASQLAWSLYTNGKKVKGNNKHLGFLVFVFRVWEKGKPVQASSSRETTGLSPRLVNKLDAVRLGDFDSSDLRNTGQLSTT